MSSKHEIGQSNTLSWMICRDCGSRMYERDWGYDCSRCDTVLKWDKGIPLSRNQPIVFREKEDGKK